MTETEVVAVASRFLASRLGTALPLIGQNHLRRTRADGLWPMKPWTETGRRWMAQRWSLLTRMVRRDFSTEGYRAASSLSSARLSSPRSCCTSCCMAWMVASWSLASSSSV